jgi:hypothetical protein
LANLDELRAEPVMGCTEGSASSNSTVVCLGGDDVLPARTATKVAFHFNFGVNATNIQCTLEGPAATVLVTSEACSSGWDTSAAGILQPGSHTFTATADVATGAALPEQTMTWTVAPAFEVEASPPMNISVTVPQTRSGFGLLIGETANLECRKPEVLDEDATWGPTPAACKALDLRSICDEVNADGASVLRVEVDTASITDADSDAAVTCPFQVVIEDRSNPLITSAVSYVGYVTFTATFMRLFPYARYDAYGERQVGENSKQQLNNEVIVGTTASASMFQLLSLKTEEINETTGEPYNEEVDFVVSRRDVLALPKNTAMRDTPEGAAILDSLEGPEASVGYFSSYNGTFEYNGQLIDTTITFNEAPTQFIGTWIQSYKIENDNDSTQLIIELAMEVIPGDVSDKSLACVFQLDPEDPQPDPGSSPEAGWCRSEANITSGETVQAYYLPRDEYGNAISAAYVFYVFNASFTGGDPLRPPPQPSNPAEVDEAYDSRTWQGAYTTTMEQVKPSGVYTLQTQYNGGAITLPTATVNMVDVACDRTLFLQVVADGDTCECLPGYQEDAEGAMVGDYTKCNLCPQGEYRADGTAAGTCSVCPSGTTTRLGEVATSEEACTCVVGTYIDPESATFACLKCPAGTYSDAPGQAACTFCPAGTFSPENAVSVDECQPCDVNQVTLVPGGACVQCEDVNANTIGDDRTKCQCKDKTQDFENPHYADLESLKNTTNLKRCNPCPEGAECIADEIYGLQGYWRKARNETELYVCKADFCLAENRDGVKLTDEAYECRFGHTGPMCSYCIDGWSKQGTFCQLCDEGGGMTPGVIIPVGLFCVILFLIAWLLQPLFFDKKKLAHSAFAMVQGKFAQAENTMASNLAAVKTALPTLPASDSSKAAPEAGPVTEAFDADAAAAAAAPAEAQDVFLGSDDRPMEAQDADMAAKDTRDPTNVGSVTQGVGRQMVGQMAERANYQDIEDSNMVNTEATDFNAAVGADGQVTVGASFSAEEITGGHMSAYDQLRGSGKIIISFMQVLSSYNEVYEIKWPRVIVDMFQWTNLIQLDLFSMPALSCVYPNSNFFFTFHIILVLPIGLVLSLVAIYFGALFTLPRLKNSKELQATFQNHFLHSILFFLFLMYPSISTRVLNVFNCTEIHGDFWLKSDLRIKCYDTEHNLEMAIAVVGLLLYPLGIPMMFLTLMHTERVHELAVYKQARLEVARLIKNVALRVPVVHDFVMECAPDRLFEEVSTDLLELVVLDLCPMRDGEESEEDEAEDAAGPVAFGEEFKAELEFPDECDADAMDLENAEHALADDANDPLRRRERLIARLLIFAHNHPVGIRLTSLPKMGWLERGDTEVTMHSTAYQVKERRAYSRLGSIFNMYHVKTWWYELLDMGRKLVMNGVLLFVGKGSTGQVALGSLVCMFMTCVHLKLNPFIDVLQNRLSMCCLLQLTSTLFVGLLLKVDITNEDAVSGNVLGALVVIMNVTIIIVPLVEIIMLISHLSKYGKRRKAFSPMRASLHKLSARIIENPTKSGRQVNEDGTETFVKQADWEDDDDLKKGSASANADNKPSTTAEIMTAL